MNAQIIKPVVGGLLIGAALFFLPFFFLKVLLIFLAIGLIFRFFGWRRFRGPRGWAYADRIRNMSDEEYDLFKRNWRGGCRKNPEETNEN